MNEKEALHRMVAPGTRRPGKYLEGVIQIWVTRACDKSCYGCTQGSNLGGMPGFITPEQFEQAVLSLKGYFGVTGVFGGNPAMNPSFSTLCEILRAHIPFEQRGLWCNNPLGKGKVMRETFNPAVSNLNVHLDRAAYDEFKRDWPEAHLVGLTTDSRHSPPYVAIKDVLWKPCPDCNNESGYRVYCSTCDGSGRAGMVYDESTAWELISNCDINKHWSAMIGVFRGELRAWFCEVAGAQAMLHQWDIEERGINGEMTYIYPDTGLDPTHLYNERIWTDDMRPGRELPWWQLPMTAFTRQVRKHCHECGVPLRGHGELAQAEDGLEQTSRTHADVYRPKRKGRRVELVTVRSQLGEPLARMTDYLGNAKR